MMHISRCATGPRRGPGGSLEDGMDATATPVLLALADDLSGAAETATLLGSRDLPVRVVLAGAGRALAPGPGVTVVDLDTRHAGADVTSDRVRAAVAARSGVRVLVKVD